MHHMFFAARRPFLDSIGVSLGKTSFFKCFLAGIAQITSPRDVFARITEPSNDDYDNDVIIVIIILVLLVILVSKLTKSIHIT